MTATRQITHIDAQNSLEAALSHSGRSETAPSPPPERRSAAEKDRQTTSSSMQDEKKVPRTAEEAEAMHLRGGCGVGCNICGLGCDVCCVVS
ncbi:hypothetical protein JCM10207_008743 [Rhodosporidiobolus poonsookiae]